MKYIVCGDTHGKIEIVRHLLSGEYVGYHKVFVGDYVDSYDRSVGNQVSIVQELLQSCRDRDDVTCLLGNHELSYMMNKMQCSGHKYATKVHMDLLIPEIETTFKTHLYITAGVLVTHAGATQQMFPNKEYLRNCLTTNADMLYHIGRARGGTNKVGGIFWCDYWEEFEPIPNLIQIMGHTAHRPHGEPRGIVMRDNAINIDCLDRVREVLIVETSVAGMKIEAIKLNMGIINL